jgi:hypothetical protein
MEQWWNDHYRGEIEKRFSLPFSSPRIPLGHPGLDLDHPCGASNPPELWRGVYWIQLMAIENERQ